MERSIEHPIERVIDAMQANLGDRITIDDMARIAMFSKFHFSRIFRHSTGVSPGRFLSALRLQEAKRLLTATSLSVADISNQVGYSSVGSFSSRFKRSVGVAPSVYRANGGLPVRLAAENRRRAAGKTMATVRGEVGSTRIMAGPIFVGLFPEPIPQGSPVCCAILGRPGPYALENVPQGTWHVLVYAGGQDGQPGITAGPLGDGRVPAIGAHGPIVVRKETAFVNGADVRLRPLSPFDPPILLAPHEPDPLPAAGPQFVAG
ncbi:helix-turn-helix domain-containing protein [Spirillospora sp. CA-294931]|uniref:helix-turn-helix domain-containing protein n=1 Tax=Spirillospora sp. CA-294931 TaxID=3240042 RepID=UPI003D9163EF